MTAEYDLEALAAIALEQAERRLGEEGGFPPFALGIEAGQPEDEPEVSLLEVGSEDGSEVPPDELLPGLIESIGDARDDWRSVAFVFDSELEDGRSAVGVLLQHSDGVGLDVYAPYSESEDGIEFDEPVQNEPSLAIWGE